MERVLGFGGFFFRARDPGMLAAWYADCLGVDGVPQDYDGKVWIQQEGPTVFAPFSDTSEYFGNPEKSWMLNFRVRDLAAMVAQLEAKGVAVTMDPQVYPNGLFARLVDPEGNPVELWQEQHNPAAP